MSTNSRDIRSVLSVLSQRIVRLWRVAKAPGGIRYLALRTRRRLLPTRMNIREYIKYRILPMRSVAINHPAVPPRNLKQLNVDPFKAKPNEELRVACIMDDFTWSSYEPECQLTQLTPANWHSELEQCQPELLFIESAWRGKDQLWGSKVGHTSQELQAIIRWCRQRHIPTIFWNKEDPVHFETFLNTARLFDYIFTTDIDSVPRYKAALGHNEVYFLPFACQPKVHNPIETYARKNAFCFAGAYYVRYPERTKDLENFVATLPDYRPLDIYDRNFGKSDPNYTFPELFLPHIVGTLPFSEIDKAYKGYRYAINLNSIKQSQTMFARRIYELLACNTLTVSNFSRGIRLMFGDLVLSSDSGTQLVQKLQSMEADGHIDRVRLLALRKVLSEHTYKDRFSYVLSRITGSNKKKILPTFRMVGLAKSEQDIERLLMQCKRQRNVDVKLTIAHDSSLSAKLSSVEFPKESNVTLLTTDQCRYAKLSELGDGCEWIVGISNEDYYGPNYLLDIALATQYSDAQVIGKSASYNWAESNFHLSKPEIEYKPTNNLLARRAAIRVSAAEGINANEWLNQLEVWCYSLDRQFAIDRFNYCASVPNVLSTEKGIPEVDDLRLDEGMALDELNVAAESLQPNEHVEVEHHVLSGAFLGRMITRKAPYEDYPFQYNYPVSSNVPVGITVSKNAKISAEVDGACLNISSRMADGQHEYLYCPESIPFDRFSKDVGCTGEDSFSVHLEVDPGLSLSLVVMFFDSSGVKLGHSIQPANKNSVVKFPQDISSLRLGLRVYAAGRATVRRLIFGQKILQPKQVFGRSDVLVLTNHYPSYNDLYRNGFVHSRVKAYRERGVLVDVLRFSQGDLLTWHEFQDIDVMTGGASLLHELLESGRFKHVLVHFLDPSMWNVLKDHLHNVKVTVWIHGAEIQPWWRREYNYLTDADLVEAKAKSEKRLEFWRSLFLASYKNFQLVFVSHYFANEVMEDVGVSLTSDRYHVIHNPVDCDLFSFHSKPAEQRKKVLSIRPYATRKYANDLSVQAVLRLATEPFFNDLEFRFIGDGVLFDEVLEPLKNYKNVIIERGFLKQDEIARLHKQYGIFLCPTRMDAQGVSKDEAMSSGLVPVTNAVTAIPEFVDDQCGILAPSENATEMASGIASLFSDPDRFVQMSKNASDRAREQVGKDKIITQELRLFLH